MRLIYFLGLTTIFFTLSHLIILISLPVITDTSLDQFYHHSSEYIWWTVYIIIPLFLSMMCSKILFDKIIKYEFFKYLTPTYLAFFIAVSTCILFFSTLYWGYAFKRPPIFREISEASNIITLSSSYRDSTHTLRSSNHPTEKELRGRINSYDYTTDRIIMTLEDYQSESNNLGSWHKIINDSTQNISKQELEKISQIIYNSGIIEKGEKRWDTTMHVYGYVAKLTAIDSDTLIYCGLKGMQISNDHYPFYEFLFSVNNRTNLKLIKSQKFFQDFAGLERIGEYSLIEPFITSVGLFLLTIFLALIYLILHFSNNKISKRDISNSIQLTSFTLSIIIGTYFIYINIPGNGGVSTFDSPRFFYAFIEICAIFTFLIFSINDLRKNGQSSFILILLLIIILQTVLIHTISTIYASIKFGEVKIKAVAIAQVPLIDLNLYENNTFFYKSYNGGLTEEKIGEFSIDQNKLILKFNTESDFLSKEYTIDNNLLHPTPPNNLTLKIK